MVNSARVSGSRLALSAAAPAGRESRAGRREARESPGPSLESSLYAQLRRGAAATTIVMTLIAGAWMAGQPHEDPPAATVRPPASAIDPVAESRQLAVQARHAGRARRAASAPASPSPQSAPPGSDGAPGSGGAP